MVIFLFIMICKSEKLVELGDFSLLEIQVVYQVRQQVKLSIVVNIVFCIGIIIFC